MVSQRACTSGTLALSASPGQSRQACGWRFGAPVPLALVFNWRFPLYKPDRLGGKQLSARGPSKRHTDQQVLEARSHHQIDSWWLCPVKCPLSVPVLAVIEVGKRYNKEQCILYLSICSMTCVHPGVLLNVYSASWCHVGWQISRGVGIRKQALYCYRGYSLRATTSLGRVCRDQLVVLVSLVLCEAVFVIPFCYTFIFVNMIYLWTCVVFT